MTRDTPLHYRSIAEISADMAAGSISAEELTRQTLERIATLGARSYHFL